MMIGLFIPTSYVYSNQITTMNKSQLRQLIREEIESSLKEETNLDRIANLFAYAGTDPSQYSEKTIQRYGEDNVNAAKEIAPKISAFENKVEQMLKQIQSDEMYPIYSRMILMSNEYSGGRTSMTSPLSDVVNMVSRKKDLDLDL
jgi:hypothetical protein